MLCLALYAEDELFYRARIMALNSPHIPRNSVEVRTVCTHGIVQIFKNATLPFRLLPNIVML